MLGRAWPAGRAAGRSPYLAIFVLALLVRIISVLQRGGYDCYLGYDSTVYYSAADALIHGRLPYRDFTLVHPPGSMLALTPFAWIGSITTDGTGYLLGNLAFTAVAAGAAVLAARVVREVVPSRAAMWSAGIGYAVYAGAVDAERASRLEPLGNFLLLLGLLCMLRAGRCRWWVAALGGAALTGAVSVKIWYVVPAVIVLTGYLVTTRRRSLRAALIGALAAGILIDGPFFIAAPRSMYRSIFIDQLTRTPKAGTGLLARLYDVSGLPALTSPDPVSHRTQLLAATLTVVVLAVVVVLAFAEPGGRLPAAMLVAQGIVFVETPSFYSFYVDYLTPAAVVCFGIAVGVASAALTRRIPRRGSGPARLASRAVLVAVSTAALVLGLTDPGPRNTPYPAAAFTSAVAGSRCVMTNNPEVLIRLDALSRGLAAGCPNWVDFNGRLLGPDRYGTGPGARDRKWHRSNARYLLSGNVVALFDGQTLNMSKQLVTILGNAPLLARSGSQCIVRVTDRQREQLRSHATLPPVIPAGTGRADYAVTMPWCPKPGGG